MPTDTLILIYVVALLAALSVIALYQEHRRRRFEPAFTQDRIFRCETCGSVYTDDPDVDRSRCPQCGKSNQPVKF